MRFVPNSVVVQDRGQTVSLVVPGGGAFVGREALRLHGSPRLLRRCRRSQFARPCPCGSCSPFC